MEARRYSRDCDGGVGIVIRAVNTQAILVWFVDIKVLDMSTFCLDPVF